MLSAQKNSCRTRSRAFVWLAEQGEGWGLSFKSRRTNHVTMALATALKAVHITGKGHTPGT